jgi:hypothetical protein
MKKFFNIYTGEIIVLLIIGLIPLLWYKDGYIGLGHDMGFPLAPVDHFLDRLYTWTDRLGPFGSNAVQVLPGVFIHGFEALLSSLGFSVLAVQKITYIFWFTLPGLTMYALLRFLHPKREEFPIRISASLFYMMNHYLLEAWTIAERTKFSIVAALPLVILLTIKVLHKKESPIKSSILLALTLFFLNGGEGIPLLISLFVAMGIALISFFLLSNESFINKAKRLLVFISLSAFFWILLSSYWLYPYLSSYNQTFGQRFEDAWGATGAISWSQSISTSTSWINLFRLRGIPDWYSNPGHPYANEFFKNPLLLLLNLIFPALAIISLLSLNKLPNLLFKARIYFLILLLIAVPLSAGSHPPFGIVYDYLLVNLPGFLLFRSGFFKFGMLIWFAYAYLIGVGLMVLIDLLKSKLLYKKYASLAVVFIYILSLFIYNYPLFTGSFFNYSIDKSTMVNVPDYIYSVKNELNQNKFSTRVLSIPNADIRTEYIQYDWGYFSLSDLSHIIGRRSLVNNGVLARPNERDFITGMEYEYINFGTSNLIKYTGINSAIVQNDFISPDYEGNPLSGIKDSFKSSKDFSFNKSLGKWDIYNYNEEILPQIYSPTKIAFVSSTSPDLYLVANLPLFTKEEAFVWSDNPADSKKESIYDKFVIQANCTECPPAESYQIYFSPSKQMIPGTFLYAFGKYISKARYHYTGSPSARVEMNLSTSTNLISDLGVLQAKPDQNGVNIASRDLIQNLEELKQSLDQITDQNLKQSGLKKARFYLNFFVNYESQWAAAAQPGSIKADLTALEKKLKETAEHVQTSIGDPIQAVDTAAFNYRLDVPESGDYILYLYKKTFTKSDFALEIDKKPVAVDILGQGWFKTRKIQIDGPSVQIRTIKNEETEERPVVLAELVKSTPNIISPQIKFVALNQTKYLVKTTGSDHFVLGFNSRIDSNWSLREIKEDTSQYFKGTTLSFQNGKVTEFERQDRHILTDIDFPTYGNVIYPRLIMNNLSSGFIINTESSNPKMEHTYLLEYNNQNSFYKAAGVSITSLLALSAFYLLRYAKRKR